MSLLFFCFLQRSATLNKLGLHVGHQLLQLPHLLGLLRELILLLLVLILSNDFDVLAFLRELLQERLHSFFLLSAAPPRGSLDTLVRPLALKLEGRVDRVSSSLGLATRCHHGSGCSTPFFEHGF